MQLLVDLPSRKAKQRAHTATHLLHYLLDQLLEGTKQAGSLVDDDYLRFDFAAKEPLTLAQLHTLETQLNEWIINDIPVIITEMSLEEAKQT
jgi:alanyl-tRNA synthetase